MIKNWETKMMKLSDVVPMPNNHRIIDPEALKGLMASISRFGMVELLVVNKRTNHLLSGHQRYAILLQKGVTEVPMIVVDMTTEDEVAASITMNNPTIEGEFDEPVMELMDQIQEGMPELYDAVRIDDLQESLERTLEKSLIDDSGPEVPENEWDTECPCCAHKWKVDAKDIVVVKTKV